MHTRMQPLDVLRTRMQADAALGAKKSTRATLKALLKEAGVRGMWRGTGPTVVRLSLGAGINFVVLEKLKETMLHVGGFSFGGWTLVVAVVGGWWV
jgi:solute carrier family 25 protein 38